MKRKTMTMMLCLLTVLSLVGVGFASWIINDGDEEVRNGNIVVDTVSDERLELTVTPLQLSSGVHNTALDINFTAPSGYDNNNKWLQSDTTVYESLEVSFNCTVSKKNNTTFTSVNDIVLTLDFTEPALTKQQQKVQNGELVTDGEGQPVFETVDTAYGAAKKANCFAFATSVDGKTAAKDESDNNISGLFISNLTLSQDKETITFELTIKYVWGTAFGGENPFDFYAAKAKASTKCNEAVGNILAADATWGDHAAYYLGLLEAISSTASYSLTIQVDPNL